MSNTTISQEDLEYLNKLRDGVFDANEAVVVFELAIKEKLEEALIARRKLRDFLFQLNDKYTITDEPNAQLSIDYKTGLIEVLEK